MPPPSRLLIEKYGCPQYSVLGLTLGGLVGFYPSTLSPLVIDSFYFLTTPIELFYFICNSFIFISSKGFQVSLVCRLTPNLPSNPEFSSNFHVTLLSAFKLTFWTDPVMFDLIWSWTHNISPQTTCFLSHSYFRFLLHILSLVPSSDLHLFPPHSSSNQSPISMDSAAKMHVLYILENSHRQLLDSLQQSVYWHSLHKSQMS